MDLPLRPPSLGRCRSLLAKLCLPPLWDQGTASAWSQSQDGLEIKLRAACLMLVVASGEVALFAVCRHRLWARPSLTVTTGRSSASGITAPALRSVLRLLIWEGSQAKSASCSPGAWRAKPVVSPLVPMLSVPGGFSPEEPVSGVLPASTPHGFMGTAVLRTLPACLGFLVRGRP